MGVRGSFKIQCHTEERLTRIHFPQGNKNTIASGPREARLVTTGAFLPFPCEQGAFLPRLGPKKWKGGVVCAADSMLNTCPVDLNRKPRGGV